MSNVFEVVVGEADKTVVEGLDFSLHGMIQETWTLDGVKHRVDGPAVTLRDECGNLWLQEWYSFGQLHRQEGPARIIDAPIGNERCHPFTTTEFYELGKEHRALGPSSQETCKETGMTLKERWKRNGEFHRVGGPAEINVDPYHGDMYREAWYENGKLHRLDGPASIGRDIIDNNEITHRWFRFGQPHRADGPAFYMIDSNTGMIVPHGVEYHLEGKRVSSDAVSPDKPEFGGP